MNYFSIDRKLHQAMQDIFGKIFPENGKVYFTVSYAHYKRLTFVAVQVNPSKIIHSLNFYYYPGIKKVYDVIKYQNKRFMRLGTMTKLLPQVQLLNNFIVRYIPFTKTYPEKNIISI